MFGKCLSNKRQRREQVESSDKGGTPVSEKMRIHLRKNRARTLLENFQIFQVVTCLLLLTSDFYDSISPLFLYFCLICSFSFYLSPPYFYRLFQSLDFILSIFFCYLFLLHIVPSLRHPQSLFLFLFQFIFHPLYVV